jgi:threonine dehydratase
VRPYNSGMKQDDVVKALQRDHAAELKLAASRLDGTARHTRIMPSPSLSETTGYEILLKPENLQVTGSFKIRGAYNKIASLSDEELARGIITASAGNHAQGVAYASRERGAKATIVMPESTPPLKVDATKSYGANVVLHGSLFDEAAAYASELSQRDGMIYVPPFDDYEVLCGQGTIGLEILEDVPDVTDVVVALGGGGLGAGVALAIKTFKPEVRVFGAIPEGSPAFKDSFAAGSLVPADKVVTSAEGVAVAHPGDLTFAILNEYLDDLVTVSERDINEMILLMLEKHKLVVEAAGAVSLAALEHLTLRSRVFSEANGKHVIVPIISGGNIDTVTISAVIQKGMIARGRIMNFEVELPDTPGQLVKVAQVLAAARANVIQLDHDQFKASSHYTDLVSLEVTVETNGPDHIAQVLTALKKAGFNPKRIY